MAGRLLRNHSGYVALCTLTLTFAVGANLTIFSIVNALWIRPRPVVDPDRVVVISTLPAIGDMPADLVKTAALDEFRRLPLFAGVAGQVAGVGMLSDFRPSLTIERVGHAVETLAVTSQYFSVLGVGVNGRDFTAEDDRHGSSPVAIISERLWRSAFNRSADVLGATFTTSRMPIRIIGVAPSGFQGARMGERVDLWIPRALAPLVSALPADELDPAFLDRMTPLIGLARLRSGVSAGEVERALTRPRARFVVRPLGDVFGAPDRSTVIVREQRTLRVLSATAMLVLLAGCATLAALILVHYERRREELAVRLAIGASLWRLGAQLGRELLVVGATGAAGAVIAAQWLLQIIPSLHLPDGVDLGRLDLLIDWRVVAVGVLATAGCLGSAAAVSIVRFAASRPIHTLISTSAPTTSTSVGLRKTMLGFHATATIVVLVGSGLFLRTMNHAFGRAAGFDVDHTVFLDLRPSVGEFFDSRDGAEQAGAPARKGAAYERLMAELRALPGIQQVSVGDAPLQPELAGALKPSAITADSTTRQMVAQVSNSATNHLATLGANVVMGRPLAAEDVTSSGARSAVINASFAASMWPNGDALGHTFAIGSRTFVVVGVVSDMACYSLRLQACARIFTASNGEPDLQSTAVSIALRTRRDASALVDPVTRIASSIFPKASRLSVQTGRMFVAANLGQERLGVWFFSGFGLVTLVLGVAGVFGLAAYLTQSRRREFGIRMALGASHAELRRQVLSASLLPVVFGTATGLIAAVVLTRSVEAMLIGVRRLDLVSYAAAAAVMLGSAAVAGVLGARRLGRLSASDALRAQ